MHVIQIGLDEALKLQEAGDLEKYDAFKAKFKPKKTTDDCYTPANVYCAVLDWVRAEYGLGDAEIIRPFFPGEDYQAREYPNGCVVVDNPPFSILAQIIRWYTERGVRFFLFAPALTLFSARNCDICYIPCGSDITYENGAEIATSFLTNLDNSRVRTAPALYQAIKAANNENLRAMRKELPRYSYPDHVITAAIVQRWCQYGVEYRLDKADCVRISTLDAQRSSGKSIFGGGYLLADAAAAERAAAERAAAERAATTKWQLSDRERMIIAGLGKGKGRNDDGS